MSWCLTPRRGKRSESGRKRSQIKTEVKPKPELIVVKNDMAIDSVVVYEQSCRAIADDEVKIWHHRFIDEPDDATDDDPMLSFEIQDAIGRKETDFAVLEGLAAQATENGMYPKNLADYGERVILIRNVKDAVKGYRRAEKSKSEDCMKLNTSFEENGFNPENVRQGIFTSQTKIAGTLLRLIPAAIGFNVDLEGMKLLKFLLTLAAMTLDAPAVGPFRSLESGLHRGAQRGIAASKLAVYWRIHKQGTLAQKQMQCEAASDISKGACSTRSIESTRSALSETELQNTRETLEKQLVEKPFAEEAFWTVLDTFQSLGGDATDVQLFRKEGNKQTSRHRLDQMVYQKRFPVLAFKKELAALQRLGDGDIQSYQQVLRKYSLQYNLDKLLREDPFSLRAFKVDLSNLQASGGSYSVPAGKFAETQLAKAVDLSDSANTANVIQWKNALLVHGSNVPLVQKTEKLLAQMWVKNLQTHMDKAPLTDQAILTFRTAIALARERGVPCVHVDPYETFLNDKEITYLMEKAQSVVASYMQWTDVSSLETGRRTLTRAIDASQSRPMHDETQHLLLHRRRIHNRLEDRKGKIRVFARIRPSDKMDQVACAPHGEMGISVSADDDGRGCESEFHFDACFAPGSQKAIFADVADLLQSCIDGYRCAIFAYGQTGSGKTHTMFGSAKDPGITRRTGTYLFNLIRGQEVAVYGSMVEIYRKQAIDLIADDKHTIAIGFDDARGQVTMDGLVERKLESPVDLEQLILAGSQKRKVAATNMNAHSSRSHALVQLRVVSKKVGSQEEAEGKMVLVDLAGSERLKKSGVSDDAAEDAIQINLSLTALGDVMQAAAKSSKNIPYRSHVLTKILRDTLGGSAKTLMFVNVSPCVDDRAETLQSLRWASKVKNMREHLPDAKKCIRQAAQNNSSGDNRRGHTVEYAKSNASELSLPKLATRFTF